MNEGTPLWQSPASSVASVAGSSVRDGPARTSRRTRNRGLLPTTVTPRMIRTATVVGLLVVMAFYIIGGSTLSTTVQGAVVSRTQKATTGAATTATTLADVEAAEVKNSRTEDVSVDSVLFLPGFGAPLEKQVRRQSQVFALLRGGNTTGGVFLSVLLPLWPLALICVVVLVVLKLIDGPCLDYYVWYVNSLLAWSE
ncbi:hypothetical protein P3T76_009650 [Phytophthora citrophthora]|uniref:Transmembrane protein n=1 Tax=Phytophthora citrophthora TaxID=4793 RepID=A0AAD9LIG5_9STRA|nr:hypothetical protein P3T76_009650 [Phytophthora citrophthora]